MTQNSPVETILDRRQLRRKLTFWRIAALVVAGLAIFALAGRFGASSLHLTPHIARIEITGVITGDNETLKLIRQVGASNEAKALIVKISSPGGTVTGSEHIYDELRRVAAKKPVVAVVDSMAASGGYIVALRGPTAFSPTTIRWSARSACCSNSPMSPSCSTRSA